MDDMQNMMQKKEHAKAPEKKHKKEKTNIVICPRCGAGNLASQSACGRCGLVFPKDKATHKGKEGELPGTPSMIPPSLPGAPRGNPISSLGDNEGGEDAPEEPQAPKRPKQLPEHGDSEGISKETSGSMSCPRCGMDMRADSKRCPHCGFKK